MYNIEGKFFYEILDDYKSCDNKEEIFNEFCNLIWNSKNERYVFTNYISFKTNECEDYNYKNLFDKYNKIPYIDYKRTCAETDFVSLLRQKLNNIYSLYCDKRVYLKKNYMDLIKCPKNMYFKFLQKDSDVLALGLEELDLELSNAITEANVVKNKYVNGKILIGWNKYILLMNSFMKKCFNNYIPLSQSESKDEFVFDIDLWTDDNYCVKYFCKSIERYFKNYEKEYFKVRQKKKYKECVKCSGLIEMDDKSDTCYFCRGYKKIGLKYLVCCDCGVEFEINSLDNQTQRCNGCYKKYRNIKNREKALRYYYKNK